MQRRYASLAVIQTVGVFFFAMAQLAPAATFTVQMERTDGSGAVTPATPMTYAIKGYLTDTDNEGLAFFLYDLEVVNSPQPVNLATAVSHAPGPDVGTFVPNLGYAHDYNGTPAGDDLLQAGGAQNTIQNDPGVPGLPPFPSGAVALNIGHDVAGVVLHEGTLTLPGDALPGDYTFQIAPASLLANVVASYDGFTYTVVAANTVIGSAITFTYEDSSCVTAADCADLNGDSVTDDVCTRWACVAGSCSGTAKVHPADLGSALGECPLDGFCNLADALHALTCFSGNNTCEILDSDAGGALGECAPDGFCNLADALHALTCFAGTNTCACGPAPESASARTVVGTASLAVIAETRVATPGSEVQVRVFLTQDRLERGRGKANLGAYQLHTAVSGGRQGSLKLAAITIEPRADFVFAGSADVFDAVNVDKSQMLAGLYGGSVETSEQGYLATFTYRVSEDAIGTFVVDVLHDEAAADQTFLVGDAHTDQIAIGRTNPAVVTVGIRRRGDAR